MELSIGKTEQKGRSKALTLPLAIGGGAAAIGTGYTLISKTRSFKKDPWTPIEQAMTASMKGLHKLYERLPQQYRSDQQVREAFQKFEEGISQLRIYASQHRYGAGNMADRPSHSRQPVDVAR